MKGNSLAIVFGVIGLVGVFGVGGYYLGLKSTERPQRGGTYTGSVVDGFNRGEDAEIEMLKRKLRENPDDARLVAYIGDLYFDRRQFAKAIDYYKRAIELNPDDVDSYNDLGLSNHYLGNSVEGLRFVEEGIKKNPYYQRIWLTKGFILAFGMGNLEKAREAWEKAVAIDPETQVGRAAKEYLAQFENR